MDHVKREFFILGVKTLTDARYFSAMAADILHFDLNPESPYHIDIPQYKAIIEWVEGSEIISSFDHLFDEEKIRELIEIPNLDGVLSRYPDMLDFVHRLDPELSLYQYIEGDPVDPDLPIAGVITKSYIDTSVDQYILYPDVRTAMDGIRQNSQSAGVALHPGGEDEVGIKDFEMYDRLFYGEF